MMGEERIRVAGAPSDPPASMPKLLIIDTDSAFCALAAAVSGPGVRVQHGSLTSAECDCILHPGNPYGHVVSQCDRAILEHFGPTYLNAMHARLHEVEGELTAGTTCLVRTDHPLQRWVLYAVCYPQNQPAVAYVSLTSALQTILKHNAACEAGDAIRTLACPGLGTYRGCSHQEEAALQMAAAFSEVARDVARSTKLKPSDTAAESTSTAWDCTESPSPLSTATATTVSAPVNDVALMMWPELPAPAGAAAEMIGLQFDLLWSAMPARVHQHLSLPAPLTIAASSSVKQLAAAAAALLQKAGLEVRVSLVLNPARQLVAPPHERVGACFEAGDLVQLAVDGVMAATGGVVAPAGGSAVVTQPSLITILTAVAKIPITILTGFLGAGDRRGNRASRSWLQAHPDGASSDY